MKFNVDFNCDIYYYQKFHSVYENFKLMKAGSPKKPTFEILVVATSNQCGVYEINFQFKAIFNKIPRQPKLYFVDR